MRWIKTVISGSIGFAVHLLQGLTFVFLGSRRVGTWTRLAVLRRIVKARRANKGRSASSFGEQLVLVDAILCIPPDKPGVVAEFGCFKGLSTVAISIAAKCVGRQVVVFDSFEGLPEPEDAVHQMVSGSEVKYERGAYAGSLDEVRSVVSKYGEMGQVEFVRGFFCDTLPRRPAGETYVLIFEDADLVQSVRDVLQHAWPRLQGGCVFFSHEALDLEVAKLFFDDAYWLKTNGQKSPGLAGVGLGLPLNWGKWGTESISSRLGSSLAAITKPSQ
jgi:O-methyltransferase